MSAITKYGSLWGDVPQTTGRVFWVSPTSSYTIEGKTYSASDNNDGLWPDRALLTVNQAVTLATADVGDIIMIVPGTHTFSATQTISKAGLRIFGVAGGPFTQFEHGTRTTRFITSVTATAANIFTVTAARVEIAFLHLVPVASKAGVVLAADDFNMHNCTWNITTAAATDTFGVSVTGSSARPRISNNYVYVSDNQGPFIRCASATAGMDGGMFARSRVILVGTTAWDDVVEITTGVDNFEVVDIDFLCSSGGLITNCVNVTGNTNDNGVMVRRCMHPVGTTLTTATATSDIVLCNNYVATIRGGTGGTLTTG